MSTSVNAICEAAYQEIGVLGEGQPMSALKGAAAVKKLNLLLDNLNAERCGVYTDLFPTGVLVPNLAPHTIGPSGTYVVTQRPVTLDGCNIIDSSVTPPCVIANLNIRDQNWWLAQSVKALTSTLPTDVYYQPSWPNGNLFFWPVPTVAYGVEFMIRVVLAGVTLQTVTDAMPPGYEEMVTLTLAEMLAPGESQAIPASTAKRAREARARVYANNDITPKVATKDYGMPGGRRQSDFNWRSGQVVG